MKKLKNLWLGIGLAAIFLAGCNQEPKVEYVDKNPPKTIAKDTPSSGLVKINIKNATGFGTVWGANAATTKAEARSRVAEAQMSDIGLTNGSDTLISFDKDGNATYALEKPEGLAAWCDYQPVREIYQCPYSSANTGARGVYVVFSTYVDFWEDEAGTKLSPIGQLMYVKPDGTVVDVFGKEGKATAVTLDTRIKENDDFDYIKFDSAGNIYALVKDQNVSKICRFNPLDGKVDFYSIPGTKHFPLNFEVTKDGAYILLNTLVNYEGQREFECRGKKDKNIMETGENYVYAIPVNSTEAATILYEPIATNAGREVPNICYDTMNNTVYFSVYCDYSDHASDGLYVWKQNASGKYATKRVFFTPQSWAWRYKELVDVDYEPIYEKCRKLFATDPDKAAKDFLDYLKSFYGPNKDKVYFTLDFFRNYENAAAWEGGQNPADIPALDVDDVEHTTNYKILSEWSPYVLYKTDEAAEPKVLTEVAALKYLMGTKNTFGADATDLQKEREEKGYDNMWDTDILDVLFNWQLDGFNKIYDEEGNTDFKFHNPLWLLFTTNENGIWTSESAAYPGSYDITNADQRNEAKAWCFSEYYGWAGQTLAVNNDGLWAFFDGCDDWGKTGWQADYTKVGHVFDSDGHFNTSCPESVSKIQGYKLPHTWLKGDVRNRIDSDPWYKAPFKGFADGFVLKDRSNDAVWYYDCGTKTASCVFNAPGLNIYSYALNNGVLTINGYTELGGNRTIKVNLKDGNKQSSINTLAKFETLIDVSMPAE